LAESSRLGATTQEMAMSPKDQARVSEAALCGKLLTESLYSRVGLLSDDAPQFKLFGLIP
jgi:hypothetical protein